MREIADAVGITKAGLYYFVESKEHLLYLITDYGLDRLDETVLNPLDNIESSIEHLRKLIAREMVERANKYYALKIPNNPLGQALLQAAIS